MGWESALMTTWCAVLELPAVTVKAEKQCTGCHATKGMLAFARNAQLADGRQSECRLCFKLRYKFMPTLTSWHRARAKARKQNRAAA